MLRLRNAFKTSQNRIRNRIVILLLLEIFISIVTAPILIFYGPFDHLKSMAVGSLYTTLSKRWIVEYFLSDQAIDEIIGHRGFYKQSDSEELRDLDYTVQHNDKIDFIKIDGGSLMLRGYMLVIHDPTAVKVGYSKKLPIEGELTTEIAKRNGAVAAINAGGFIYDGAWARTGGKVDGYIIHEGKVIQNSLKDEKKPYDAVGLNNKGQLIFGSYSINKLRKMGVTEAVSFFGPKLIMNGKKLFSAGEDGGMGINPRTAIGQKATGEILFLVIDGRGLNSLGATMYDLQEILYEHGAVNAINLDGGSSSTMYYKGQLINNPSNAMGERAIPSVFMVIPKKGSEN